MDDKHAVAVGVAFGVGSLGVGWVLPHVAPSIPLVSSWCIFATGVVLILLSVVAIVRPHWFHSLRRTQELAPSAKSDPESQYLPDRDTELGSAIFIMVLRSAWGRGYAAQHLAGTGNPMNDRQLMMIATHVVVDKAMNGALEIRGRLPNETQYETIPRENWRLAHLGVEPDLRRIWAFPVTPRSNVDPKLISRLLSYNSLIVDSRQFESIWPRHEAETDAKRRKFLKQARKNGADPTEIAKLS